MTNIKHLASLPFLAGFALAVVVCYPASAAPAKNKIDCTDPTNQIEGRQGALICASLAATRADNHLAEVVRDPQHFLSPSDVPDMSKLPRVRQQLQQQVKFIETQRDSECNTQAVSALPREDPQNRIYLTRYYTCKATLTEAMTTGLIRSLKGDNN
jgi:hypothetical protein